MGRLDYDVLYTTSESEDELRRRLSSLCGGAWGLRIVEARRNRPCRYAVWFEREDDITALCRTPAPG